MARRQLPRKDSLEATDLQALITAQKERLSYLTPKFWSSTKKNQTDTTLYCASVDLKRFYPSISSKSISLGLLQLVKQKDPDRQKLASLIDNMLAFRFDPSGLSAQNLKYTEPRYRMRGHVSGIPTGLFVGGFLANAAMLETDLKVQRRVDEERNVAHFRFVDDHTIIAYSFEDLCEWVTWYEKILKDSVIGVEINDDKYDPESLGKWISTSRKLNVSFKKPSNIQSNKRLKAIKDTSFDGRNPTRLLTKTLAQVSTLAMTDVETLEDHDLRERLKQLEWLLLADIPDREIRPDTRAAFAAGQIARIAPLLATERDVTLKPSRDYAVALAKFLGKKDQLSDLEIEQNETQLNDHLNVIKKLNKEQSKEETRQYSFCFNLLMQAFSEFPTKARLFLRLIQFCRVTGFNGLPMIGKWLRKTRQNGNARWADYYAGLALQTLSLEILKSTKILLSHDSLRSDVKASYAFLRNVAKMKTGDFSPTNTTETWFYRLALEAYKVSVIAASTGLMATHPKCSKALSSYLKAIAGVSLGSRKNTLKGVFSQSIPAWAHYVENNLANGTEPTETWFFFERLLNYSKRPDRLVVRRYPKYITQKAFKKIVLGPEQLKFFDSGWVLEAIENKPTHLLIAEDSNKLASRKAIKSLTYKSSKYLNLSDWVKFLKSKTTPFDPRRAEWTALEILKQIIEPIVSDLEFDQDRLNFLHPNNVLIPIIWRDTFNNGSPNTPGSWEQWRIFVNQNVTAKVLKGKNCLVDYRYRAGTRDGWPIGADEQRLAGLGRLLLGLSSLDFDAPSLWNLRGNEQILSFPEVATLEALALSSKTTSILEICLSRRSAESRNIPKFPGLFAWESGKEINDMEFDPPAILNAVDLLPLIRSAQQELQDNQIAISQNQPRQLIPFDLDDFAKMDDLGGGDDE